MTWNNVFFAPSDVTSLNRCCSERRGSGSGSGSGSVSGDVLVLVLVSVLVSETV